MRKFETKKEVREFLKQFYLITRENIVFVSLKENGTFKAVTVIDQPLNDLLLFRYSYDTNGTLDCYELDDLYTYDNAVDEKTKMYLER